MPPYNKDFDIQGCHGTIAEQTDEAYYDDRSDASDDIEKGRLKFPKRIYGREKELDKLLSIYNGLISSDSNVEDSIQEDDDEEEEQSSSNDDNSVVFLSGYSGIGKSALVNEFVRLARGNKSSDNTSNVLYVSGKYSENTKSAAPFSAITEMFDKLVSSIVKNDDQLKAIRQGIKESEMIRLDSEGSRVLASTFPSLTPLLNNGEPASTNSSSSTTAVNPSMNAIKECTREFLSITCTTLNSPPIFFLDDLQWADAASIEMLDLLLSSPKLRGIHERNVMYICAYRSNEVDDNHPFTKLMNTVIENRHSNSVEQMDLFNLSPESITTFIADSIKCGDSDEDEDDTTSNKEEVRELAEAVYQKTMGNIFFTMQALEELVRKNVLFYDVMCFEWRFVVSKVELADHMSDDVVTMVKSKIMDLPDDVQHLLIVMSYIPNALEVSVLKALLSCGDVSYEEDTIKALLKTASEEGMLLYSSDSKCYIFAHDRIRQASLEIATEKDQDGLVLHISQVLQDVASQRSEMEWCVYVAVDLLNSLPPEKSIPLGDLVKLNMKVSRLAGSKGSVKRQNELLHKALMCLDSSGGAWKDYKHTLELYNAVIVSDHALGKTLILALAFLCFISQSHYSSIITKPQDLTIRQGSLLQRSLGMPSH